MNATARHVSEMTGEGGDGGLAVLTQGCTLVLSS